MLSAFGDCGCHREQSDSPPPGIIPRGATRTEVGVPVTWVTLELAEGSDAGEVFNRLKAVMHGALVWGVYDDLRHESGTVAFGAFARGARKGAFAADDDDEVSQLPREDLAQGTLQDFIAIVRPGVSAERVRMLRGKLWKESHDARVMTCTVGLSVHHLESGRYLDWFEAAHEQKKQDFVDLPGKCCWGYYAAENDDQPVSFVLWNSEEAKNSGKDKLWDIYMAHTPHATGSIHTMPPLFKADIQDGKGGMFKEDSDRSYHTATVELRPWTGPEGRPA